MWPNLSARRTGASPQLIDLRGLQADFPATNARRRAPTRGRNLALGQSVSGREGNFLPRSLCEVQRSRSGLADETNSLLVSALRYSSDSVELAHWSDRSHDRAQERSS